MRSLFCLSALMGVFCLSCASLPPVKVNREEVARAEKSVESLRGAIVESQAVADQAEEAGKAVEAGKARAFVSHLEEVKANLERELAREAKPDPVPAAQAVASAVSPFWPPASLVLGVLGVIQTWRQKKAEEEAEGGTILARAIEEADEVTRKTVKASVLAKQEKLGQGRKVTALLRRAKV